MVKVWQLRRFAVQTLNSKYEDKLSPTSGCKEESNRWRRAENSSDFVSQNSIEKNRDTFVSSDHLSTYLWHELRIQLVPK